MRATTWVSVPNEHGLYVCAHCPREHSSPLAAALCCDTDYEPEGER